MEMSLSNGFTSLMDEELYIIEGGNEIAYDIGYGVGVVLGLIYDAAVIVRAVYTGSF